VLTIDTVGRADLPELMPMLRAYCDFYRVEVSDERLRALVSALIDNPAEGLQLIARDGTGAATAATSSTGAATAATSSTGAATAATSSTGAATAATSRKGTPLGFATIYWTWQTLYAARVGVLNDLFVVPASRGIGAGRALIERCRELCRERGAQKLVWETALDNVTAQRLYDGIGAEKSTWLTYEMDA
jgi:GNAT superfamily N-acetyltransferase